MRDGEDDDKAGRRQRIACDDQTGRALLALFVPGGSFARPQVIVAEHQTGPRLRYRRNHGGYFSSSSSAACSGSISVRLTASTMKSGASTVRKLRCAEATSQS